MVLRTLSLLFIPLHRYYTPEIDEQLDDFPSDRLENYRPTGFVFGESYNIYSYCESVEIIQPAPNMYIRRRHEPGEPTAATPLKIANP